MLNSNNYKPIKHVAKDLEINVLLRHLPPFGEDHVKPVNLPFPKQKSPNKFK